VHFKTSKLRGFAELLESGEQFEIEIAGLIAVKI